MNEFILVEFLVSSGTDLEILKTKLYSMGEDYEHIKDEHEFEDDNMSGFSASWVRYSGKINSVRASLIKLQDQFLADRMRISYIPTEMKDKYRK